MPYYKTLTESGKAKKHYTYGVEEGSRYSKKGTSADGRGSREKDDASGSRKKTYDRPAANGRFGKSDRSSGARQKSEPARKYSSDRRNTGSGRNAEKPVRRIPGEKQPKHTPAAATYSEFEYREPVREESVSHDFREEQEKYILTGRNPIREALKNHRDLEKLLVQKGELSGSAMEIVSRAKEQKIMVQVVEKSRLDEIAPQHQGLIAFASAYQYASVEDILSYAGEKGEDPFIIILDGITDPHNLGAIIRTAECAGAHGVIVPQHRSVGLTPAAVKASAGAVEYVRVARVTNLNRTIEDLQKRNIWVYALDMDGQDFTQIQFDGGTALVIGAEGEGISRLTGTKCDMKVALPMKGHLDSLNASVAAGIMMYRVMNCRK